MIAIGRHTEESVRVVRYSRGIFSPISNILTASATTPLAVPAALRRSSEMPYRCTWGFFAGQWLDDPGRCYFISGPLACSAFERGTFALSIEQNAAKVRSPRTNVVLRYWFDVK